jgi:hypothetical protein
MIIVLFGLCIFIAGCWFVVHQVRIILHRQKVQHEANEAILARERRDHEGNRE